MNPWRIGGRLRSSDLLKRSGSDRGSALAHKSFFVSSGGSVASSVLLLIMGQNNTHPDSQKDEASSYKRGHIVRVMDGSAHDGNLALNPIQAPWILIRITGATVEQVKKYTEQHEVEEIDNTGTRTKLVRKPLKRRRYRVRVDDLPGGFLAQLAADRYAEVTFAQARNYVRDDVTGLDGMD